MKWSVKGFSCWAVLGLTCLLLSCPRTVLGSGFALFETGARATALGSAVVGRADDPSAIFFNPAGITQLPGLQFMGGGTLIVPTTDVITRNAAGQEVKNTVDGHVWVPPHMYLTYQINNSLWFGFGLFTPFGLGTEFDGDWPGRFNAYKAVIQTLNINPNIAWKINDQLSVAAGIDIMWFDTEIRNKIPVATEPDQRVFGDSFGFGYNAAIRYQPFDWVALGVSYRSQMRQDLDLQADFTTPLQQFGLFRDTGAAAALTLPDHLFMGLTFYPIKDLSLEIGAFWTNWSVFKELTLHYDTPIAPGQDSVTQVKQWNDTWRIHGGIEYAVTEWLDLRAGYEYDMEPSPDKHVDYLVPANDRHLFSFGPGIHWCGWNLDMSYTYLLITDRDVEARPLEGILESRFRDGDAHIVGISLSRGF